MSEFLNTARAVEPVIKMLDGAQCGAVSANIFEDGSGSLIVHTAHKDKADKLMQAHGVNLRSTGHQDLDNKDDYHFSFIRAELVKYSETLCPHCGKDTAAKP